MEKYVALLRGINVSGQKKVLMAVLKTALEELGYNDVTTYIQSGNIVFAYNTTSVDQLAKQINKKILDVFDFDVPTLVIRPEELEYVIKTCPFHSNPEIPVEKSYVTFLERIPEQQYVKHLDDFNFDPEIFVLDQKYVFFYSPKGYGNAKMNNNWFENKLKVKATTRNWKTINKLLEMSK